MLALCVYSCAACERLPCYDHKSAELEEFLIDFSKKMAGHVLIDGPLPDDIDQATFFTILERYYTDHTLIDRVRRYPVHVDANKGSYTLSLCDRRGRWAMYKDLGETIDKVDFPYVRLGQAIPCPAE